MSASVTCPNCGFVSWNTGACKRCSSSLASAATYTFQPPVMAESEGVPLYFAVSKNKLAVLSVCTLGLYHLYWFYKHWQTIKRNEGSDISPFWRTFFCIFYQRALFRSIKETAELYGVEANYNPLVLSLAYIGLNCCARFGIAGWMLGLCAFYPLAVAQTAANRINAAVAPAHDRNDQFTAANIIAIVLGGLFLMLALLGTIFGVLLGVTGKGVN
jgi:hypothetical protein